MRKTPEGQFGASPQTEALRPQHGLSMHQVDSIRQARKNGDSAEKIADLHNIPLDAVNIALSNLRTEREDPGRFTLNVSEAAYNFVNSRQESGEPAWKTVNRLFGIN